MTKTKVPRLRFSGFSGEWKEEKLGDVSTNSKGSGLSKESINVDKKGQPVVHYADIYKFNNIVNEVIHWSEKDEGKIIPDNSVIFPMSDVTPNGLAKCSVVNVTRVKAGGDILIFSMNQEISSRYISYFISGNKKKVLKLVSGTSVKHISSKSISKILISFPELNEQQKIGDFFAKQDKLIELQTQKVDQLKKLKRGYLQKMFPQEGETVPRLRFSGFSGEWKEAKIEDIYSIGRGLVLSKKRISLNKTSGNIFPVYSSQTQNNGLLGYYSNYLYEDSITWTTDGANAGTVRFRSGKFYSTNVNGVLTNSNGYCNSMMANAIDRVAYKYVSHVGNPKLMNNTMKIIKIKYPSIIEQKKISSFINNIDHIIEEQSNKIGELKKQKKSYLQKMFV